MGTANTGAYPMLPRYYGLIDENGGIISGTDGFSVIQLATGGYKISTSVTSAVSTTIVSPMLSYVYAIARTGGYQNTVIIETYDFTTGNHINTPFNFMIFDQ
ncbi:MAG: hypothetical protein IPH84_20505 [Bacteroidales bacterium]|nr:hypothetical protein [Bacteroidales bacterium]